MAKELGIQHRNFFYVLKVRVWVCACVCVGVLTCGLHWVYNSKVCCNTVVACAGYNRTQGTSGRAVCPSHVGEAERPVLLLCLLLSPCARSLHAAALTSCADELCCAVL